MTGREGVIIGIEGQRHEAVQPHLHIVAGTAALWAGTRVRGVLSTIGASLIMGVAVSGMHYVGMAAMRVSPGSMSAMSGSTGFSFIAPLVIGLTVVTFVIALAVSVAPTNDEIAADAALQRRTDELEARRVAVAADPLPWERPDGPDDHRARPESSTRPNHGSPDF